MAVFFQGSGGSLGRGKIYRTCIELPRHLANLAYPPSVALTPATRPRSAETHAGANERFYVAAEVNNNVVLAPFSVNGIMPSYVNFRTGALQARQPSLG